MTAAKVASKARLGLLCSVSAIPILIRASEEDEGDLGTINAELRKENSRLGTEMRDPEEGLPCCKATIYHVGEDDEGDFTARVALSFPTLLPLPCC